MRAVDLVGHDGGPLRTEAARALAAATLVAGGRRHLERLDVPPGARTVVMGDVTAAVAAVAAHDGPAVVVASGDPGFFGILRRLRSRGLDVTVHPAVSSVAHAFARAGLPWDDAAVVSAHGRDPRAALAVVRSGVRCAVLTDAVTGPRQVAAAAPPDARLVVCERLGADGERVVTATAAQVAAGEDDWREPNVVVVDPVVVDPVVVDPGAAQPPAAADVPPSIAGPRRVAGGWALDDAGFEHRDGMITKAEVRAWALARLGPRPGITVWDVGAGSGSVAVECARLGAAAVAVERDPRQGDRIRRNAARHGVRVVVVEGAAPAALAGLPAPDAVFVGGGGLDVLAAVVATRPPVVVVALAAVDRIAPAADLLRDGGYTVGGVQLAASRLTDLPGGSLRLSALNPVVVLVGEPA